MADGLTVLCVAAASIGCLHTLLGPDHYLPFVAMSRVGRWSLTRTILVTVLCGLGHVLSSATLGLVGFVFGVTILRLEKIEAFRAGIAGWLLLAFGLVYFVWGIRRAIRNQPHTHHHIHADGTIHLHEHTHVEGHLHVHDAAKGFEKGAVQAASRGGEVAESVGRPEGRDALPVDVPPKKSMTPWVLFTIFVFGPCEPLIPMLMYPAAKGSVWSAVLVTAIFGVVTLATMTTVVVVAYLGVGSLRLAFLERYSHAVAGFVILACGAAIKAGL